jgi:hypothetical protein
LYKSNVNTPSKNLKELRNDETTTRPETDCTTESRRRHRSAMSDICLATRDARCCFEPMRFARHAPGALDVTFDVKFCGVCHSDVHSAKGELLRTTYPVCPGHEIAGVVTSVGAQVSKFKVGDHVGVGCFVDSCLECAPCKRGEEQFCTHASGMTGTYGATPAHGRAGAEQTTGGYSTRMVVNEHFAIALPQSMPLEKAGTTCALPLPSSVSGFSLLGEGSHNGLFTPLISRTTARICLQVRSSARALPHTLRSRSGTSARRAAWASTASAGSARWRSSRPRR